MTFHKWARPAMMLTAKIRENGKAVERIDIHYEHPYANDDAIANERQQFVVRVLSKHVSSIVNGSLTFYLGGRKLTYEQVESLHEKGRI